MPNIFARVVDPGTKNKKKPKHELRQTVLKQGHVWTEKW